MNYKKTNIKIIYCVVAFSLVTIQSCDTGFEELNKNPDAVSELTPEYMFTKAQLDAINCGIYGSHIVGSGGFVQHFATYKDVPSLGDRYTWSQGGYPYEFFSDAYPNAVNEIGEVIRATADDPEQVNKFSTARIWRVFIMHRITDLYGDIPYSEAGRGYSDNILTPKYDEQSFIYNDMLSELEKAIVAFDSSKPTFGTADLMYSGNVDQWKKFGYSLMLRLGMRLTKADISAAQTWAQKAINGGVILLDEDIARIEYTDGPQTFNRNPIAYNLLSNDYGAANGKDNKEGGKYAKTFIDYLKSSNDPRLGVLSVVWNNGVTDTTASLQKGMQNGAYIGTPPADFVTYSEPNPETVLQSTAPYLAITNAEMYLLLAEASVRGWYGENAGEAYQNAIEASMRSWSLYGDAGVISDSKVQTYVAANALTGTSEEMMEQIHIQFWVALFPNEPEIFANWRRTGYPILTPVNVPGNLTNGTIPRRLIYPPAEKSLNTVHYQEAVDRIDGGGGEDVFYGRVWWDK